MRTDRLLMVLVVVILAASVAVFLSKRVSVADESEPTLDARAGTLSLLVVGVEGLDLSIVERLSSEGRLPNLTALFSDGAVGEFQTLGRGIDPRIAWTSLVTGVTPEKQGIGGTRVSAKGKVVEEPKVPKSRTVGTLWTALSDAGRPVGVIGWWGTWPAERLNGVVLVPYTTYVLQREHNEAPELQLYPVELLPIVDPLVDSPGNYSRRDLSRFLDTETYLGMEALIGKGFMDLSTAYAGDTSTRDVARALTVNPGLTAEFVLLQGVEIVSQRFWHMAHPDEIAWDSLTEHVRELVTDQIEALGGVMDLYYETVDEILGDLIELAADDATVVVVSDHGYDGLRYGSTGQPMLGPNMHSTTGFWVMRGPGVRGGVRARDLGLLDFAPTVAEAAGIALGNDTDGDVCREMLLP